MLPDPGPQITAQSSGSGDAGSITASANRLLISNGGAISTEARTSTASGGNITLHLRDLLYLTSSEISTSVKGETGNGGNIAIDPQLVILDHSSIIAQAVEGHGGNITITAGQFIPSSDSIVSASSELGISGTIVINGPRVDVNGALVVLATQLRSRTEVLREACSARAGQPISSLVEAGRGGLLQGPEATLPALYIAGRDLAPNPPAAAGPTQVSSALQTTVHLTMRCSWASSRRRPGCQIKLDSVNYVPHGECSDVTGTLRRGSVLKGLSRSRRCRRAHQFRAAGGVRSTYYGRWPLFAGPDIGRALLFDQC